MTISHI